MYSVQVDMILRIIDKKMDCLKLILKQQKAKTMFIIKKQIRFNHMVENRRYTVAANPKVINPIEAQKRWLFFLLLTWLKKQYEIKNSSKYTADTDKISDILFTS